MTAAAADVAALVKVLWILPPPARTMFAPKLAEAGLRVHPELATKRLVREGVEAEGNWAPQRLEPINNPMAGMLMREETPSTADVEHIGALAVAVMVLPPPLPAVIAPELYALGVRVHPELATVADAPQVKGSLLGVLRGMTRRAPGLTEMVDKVEAALNAAEAGDLAPVRALAKEMGPQVLADLKDNQRRISDVKSDDLEPPEAEQ